MTLKEIQRTLSRKIQPETTRPAAAVTMSDASLSLTRISQIDRIPGIASIHYGKNASHALFHTPSDHIFTTLDAALTYGNIQTWRLAEYYLDGSGLYLVYLPQDDDVLVTRATQHLTRIPNYIDDEESAQKIIARELINDYSRAIKVVGDFCLYFDFDKTADYIEAYVDANSRQHICLTKVDREHRLFRVAYLQDSPTMTVTHYSQSRVPMLK